MEALDSIVQIIALIVGLVVTKVGYLLGVWIKNQMIRDQIMQAISVGVATAQERYVEWAKRAKEDGKLDATEREQARKIALDVAKSLLRGKALQVFENSPQTMEGIVTNFVEGRKV